MSSTIPMPGSWIVETFFVVGGTRVFTGNLSTHNHRADALAVMDDEVRRLRKDAGLVITWVDPRASDGDERVLVWSTTGVTVQFAAVTVRQVGAPRPS